MIRFGGRRRWYWFWVPRRWPGKIKLLIFVLLVTVIVLASRIFYVIPAGRVGVLFSPFYGGTQTDTVLHEGLQIVWPWKSVYIYDHHLQSRRLSMTALVESTMQVSLDVVVYFQLIERNVPYLHKSVGENYAEMMIEPMVRSEVREVMGRVTLDTVRNSDASELERALVSQLNEAAGEQQVEDNGIMVQRTLIDFKRVVMNSIAIPNSVSQAVNWKEQQQQYLLAARYILDRKRIEADQRRVEAEGIAAANRVINGSLTAGILNWRNIEAIEALSRSGNAKVVVLGGSGKDVPVILGSDVFTHGSPFAAPMPGSSPAAPDSSKPSDQPEAVRPPSEKPAPAVKAYPFHSDKDSPGHVPIEKPAVSSDHPPHPTPPNAAPRDLRPTEDR